MIKSMTAYGRSLYLSSLGKWLIEIHSVNKKSLDFNMLMSRDLLRFDIEVRKHLSSFCKRGHVTVKIFLHPNPSSFFSGGQVEYLRSMKQGMEKVCVDLGCSLGGITFPFLYEQMESLSALDFSKQEEEVKKDLFIGLEEALKDYMKMKEAEGSSLSVAFEKHLNTIESLLEQVENRAKGSLEKRRVKILDRLKDFKEITDGDQERVLREVFLYVEKSDITEEITRLHSHIEQFKGLLQEKEESSVGRTMDFLVQEMGRESNTISSKSDDIEISRIALKLKGEVEKIREQVQNVE
ncbi:MAG: DUF1732 domain-containing protein [Chlamydiota bacterium]